MVLELHVWGPAFGLPSLDPACLATIAYFRQRCPPSEWAVIASNPSVSPLGELPALKDGDNWIAGYRNIVTYLSDGSREQWNIDGDLNEQQLADCTAYTSFVESRGLPLLDLLLYVSSENYNAATKPALANVLDWPHSWVLPGRLRERAKKRSEHLGLSALDVDTIEDDKNKDQGLTAQIPASLRKPRLTVSSMLWRDMRKNRFRLDAVTAEFLDPLEEMLGEKDWLLDDRHTTADFLAVSVLALMYLPMGLPQNWMKNAIATKYPRLARWVETQAPALFGISSPAGTGCGGEADMAVDLPWQQLPARSWQDLLNNVFTTATDGIPFLRSPFAGKEVDVSSADNYTEKQHQKQITLTRLREHHLVYSQALISSLSLTALVGVLVWKGLLTFPRHNPAPHFRNFGEAGGMLGLR